MIIFFCIFSMILSTNSLLGAFATLQDELESDASANDLAKPDPTVRWHEWLGWHSFRGMCYVWIVAFAILFSISIRLEIASGAFSFNSLTGEQLLATPEAGYLPNTVQGWKQNSFEHEHRPERHQMGSDSYKWQLSNANRYLIVSLDGTFDDYHELAVCYRNIGWDVQLNQFYPGRQKRVRTDLFEEDLVTVLEMTKPTGESGVVFFSCLDRNGDVTFPPPDRSADAVTFLKQKVAYSVSQLLGRSTDHSNGTRKVVPPVSTIQLLYLPEVAVSDQDIEELRKLYLEIRENLKQTPRFRGP